MKNSIVVGIPVSIHESVTTQVHSCDHPPKESEKYCSECGIKRSTKQVMLAGSLKPGFEKRDDGIWYHTYRVIPYNNQYWIIERQEPLPDNKTYKSEWGNNNQANDMATVQYLNMSLFTYQLNNFKKNLETLFENDGIDAPLGSAGMYYFADAIMDGFAYK